MSLENWNSVAYEAFERKSVRIEEPAIALVPNGRIALNAAASRLLKNAGIRAVRILWDRTTNGVALQAAQKGDRNSYKITFGNGYHQATFTAKEFLVYIGWAADRRQTVHAKWDEHQKILEATLPSRFVGIREKKETEREGNTGR